MESAIRVEAYRGEGVRKYIPAIAQLRMEVFREYPFLYIGDEEYEKKYLEKFVTSKEAVVVVAWKGSEIIGVSTGLPFIEESESLHEPFEKLRLPVKDFFYFGESVLQKKYRGLGIGHQFFLLREAHARSLGRYKYICFCTVKRPSDDPRRPEDYRPLAPFWQSKGFSEHPELIAMYPWQEIGEKEESLKEMVFWIKKL
ncbi:MAG: GNAT family N-acetyltransferase [Verrucomicrobia bacterium]|nr:GNAT family N-acetyltransferase [Verrucomicrobiota bacterium]